MIPSPLRRSTFPDNTGSVSTKPPAFNTSIDIARRNSTGNALPSTSLSHAVSSDDYFYRLTNSEAQFQLFAESENQAAKGFNFLKDPNKFDEVVQTYSYANQRHNETLKFLESEHGAKVPDIDNQAHYRQTLITQNDEQIDLLQNKKTAVINYNKAFYEAKAKQDSVNKFVERLHTNNTIPEHRTEIVKAHKTANKFHRTSLKLLNELKKLKAIDKQTYENDKKSFQEIIDKNDEIIRRL